MTPRRLSLRFLHIHRSHVNGGPQRLRTPHSSVHYSNKLGGYSQIERVAECRRKPQRTMRAHHLLSKLGALVTECAPIINWLTRE